MRSATLSSLSVNFYPRPPRGGRLLMVIRVPPRYSDFYPRPPRGGRPQQPKHWHRRRRFLSTPSARRATEEVCRLCMRFGISIHALREEGDIRRCSMDILLENFYPRPPRGGRPATSLQVYSSPIFLSTPSARRATLSLITFCLRHEISIHALREEGDSSHRHFSLRELYFYPRPPRGGRQQKQRQNLYFLINYTTFCTNLEEP